MATAKIFERYIQMADLLGKMFQNVLEVVVHDFKDLDHSVIHIVNGHISGRKIGDKASELGLRRMLAEEEIPDLLVNYANYSSRGQKCKSSSLAIRDDKGKMIGAFCLNFDTSQFEHFQKFLEFFLSFENQAFVGLHDINDKFTSNEDEVEGEVSRYLVQKGLMASQLTYKDKQAIVTHLQKNGFFKKRGAISAVANTLQLTRQSIYNYLELAKGR